MPDPKGPTTTVLAVRRLVLEAALKLPIHSKSLFLVNGRKDLFELGLRELRIIYVL